MCSIILGHSSQYSFTRLSLVIHRHSIFCFLILGQKHKMWRIATLRQVTPNVSHYFHRWLAKILTRIQLPIYSPFNFFISLLTRHFFLQPPFHFFVSFLFRFLWVFFSSLQFLFSSYCQFISNFPLFSSVSSSPLPFSLFTLLISQKVNFLAISEITF